MFSLTGVSSRAPRSELPGPGDNFAFIDFRSVGVRLLPNSLTGIGFDLLEFAMNTNGRRAHPAYPGGFEIDIDTTGDGVADWPYIFGRLAAEAEKSDQAVSRWFARRTGRTRWQW